MAHESLEGRRGAWALRLYDEFARRLRAEYSGEPSRETLAVVATMRGG